MDDNSLNVSNVKVAVRVRPMNRRGESRGVRACVCVLGGVTPVYTSISLF